MVSRARKSYTTTSALIASRTKSWDLSHPYSVNQAEDRRTVPVYDVWFADGVLFMIDKKQVSAEEWIKGFCRDCRHEERFTPIMERIAFYAPFRDAISGKIMKKHDVETWLLNREKA